MPRNAKLTWKSYLLQDLECKGLLAKMRVANEQGIARGPPLHDGLFVERRDPAVLTELARAMSREVSAVTGARITVDVKEIPAAPIENAFVFDYNRASFTETDFKSNLDLEDEYAIAQSLQAYNSWLSRFFVAVLKTKNPEIVEIEYFESTDRLKRIIQCGYMAMVA